ncbi:hypothetical protein [Streptomyces syringium]|uniref:hypothetical protein n=1 Tax=Streptomyces syringium TaxID=76729 RepID=UPI003429B80E
MGTSNARQHTSTVAETRPKAIKPPPATQESKAHKAVTQAVTDEQIPATVNITIDSAGTTPRRPFTDDPIPNQNESNRITSTLVLATVHRGRKRKLSIRRIDPAATGIDHQCPSLTFAVASHLNPLVRTASEESVHGHARNARAGSYFTQCLRLGVRIDAATEREFADAGTLSGARSQPAPAAGAPRGRPGSPAVPGHVPPASRPVRDTPPLRTSSRAKASLIHTLAIRAPPTATPGTQPHDGEATVGSLAPLPLTARVLRPDRSTNS